MSSNTLRTEPLPDPLRPVMMTRSCLSENDPADLSDAAALRGPEPLAVFRAFAMDVDRPAQPPNLTGLDQLQAAIAAP